MRSPASLAMDMFEQHQGTHILQVSFLFSSFSNSHPPYSLPSLTTKKGSSLFFVLSFPSGFFFLFSFSFSISRYIPTSFLLNGAIRFQHPPTYPLKAHRTTATVYCNRLRHIGDTFNAKLYKRGIAGIAAWNTAAVCRPESLGTSRTSKKWTEFIGLIVYSCTYVYIMFFFFLSLFVSVAGRFRDGGRS